MLSGLGFREYIKRNNIGTYNNQFIIVDYNLFTPGSLLGSLLLLALRLADLFRSRAQCWADALLHMPILRAVLRSAACTGHTLPDNTIMIVETIPGSYKEAVGTDSQPSAEERVSLDTQYQ